MKKMLLVLQVILFISIFSGSALAQDDGGWSYVYRGDAAPMDIDTTQMGPFRMSGRYYYAENGWIQHIYLSDEYDLYDSLWNVQPMATVVDDEENPGNKYLNVIDTLTMPDNQGFAVSLGPRLDSPDTPNQITILFRARSLTPEEIGDEITNYGWAMCVGVPGYNGTHDVRQYNDIFNDGNENHPTGIRAMSWLDQSLEWFESDAKYDFVDNLWEWHTYRYVLDTDKENPQHVATLYIDENPSPALVWSVGEKKAGDHNFELHFGSIRHDNWKSNETGGNKGGVAGSYDYIAIKLGEAWAPGEGNLPGGLIIGDSVTVGVEDGSSLESVKTFALHQNYPNPFNPTTQISYSIPVAQHVELTVFNIMGEKVSTLVDKNLSAGHHVATWNGKNYAGQNVGTGVYLVRMNTKGYQSTQKMILMK